MDYKIYSIKIKYIEYYRVTKARIKRGKTILGRIRMIKKISYKMVGITVINIFILSLIISYLLSTIKVIKGQQFLPTVFNLTGVIVDSGSMSPYAEVGDYLIIRKINAQKIKVDDVITFVSRNTLITHRVKKIVNEEGNVKILTQGDFNNILDDEFLDGSSVVGKSIVVVPKLGIIINYISSKIGLTIGIIIILLILSLVDRENKKVKT